MALFTATLNLFIYISEAGRGSYSHHINQRNHLAQTGRDTQKSSDCVRKISTLFWSIKPSTQRLLLSIQFLSKLVSMINYAICWRMNIDAGFNGSFPTPSTVPNTSGSQLPTVLGETRPDRCLCIQERRSYLLGSKDDMATQDKHNNLSSSPFYPSPTRLCIRRAEP